MSDETFSQFFGRLQGLGPKLLPYTVLLGVHLSGFLASQGPFFFKFMGLPGDFSVYTLESEIGAFRSYTGGVQGKKMIHRGGPEHRYQRQGGVQDTEMTHRGVPQHR